jgi:LPXTG-motif cell wall-anchored protein
VYQRDARLIRHRRSVTICSHMTSATNGRVSRRRVSTLLAVAAIAAAPATAYADGAGDQQYQDPLTAPAAPKKPKNTAPAAATPTTSAPAAAAAPAASTGTTAPAPAAAELPRTGIPAGSIALAGALMLASGVILRRRTASP